MVAESQLFFIRDNPVVGRSWNMYNYVDEIQQIRNVYPDPPHIRITLPMGILN